MRYSCSSINEAIMQMVPVKSNRNKWVQKMEIGSFLLRTFRASNIDTLVAISPWMVVWPFSLYTYLSVVCKVLSPLTFHCS